MILSYFRNHLKPHIYGPGYLGALKQGLVEVPAPLISGVGGTLLTIVLWPVINWKERIMNKKRYVLRYTVFRAEDERVDFFAFPPAQEEEIHQLRLKNKQKN